MKNKVVLFSLACATALSADAIKSIEYKDVNKISPQILNETLNMQVGDELDENKLNEAVIKLYQYGYFADLQLINDRGNFNLIFAENTSIASVEI